MIEEFIKTVILTGMGIQKKALETMEEIITHHPSDSSSHKHMADDFVEEAENRNSSESTEKEIKALQNDVKELKERISKLEK